MIRLVGAALRAVLVALLVVTPALLLPGPTLDSGHVLALVALVAGLLTFAEYYTDYPSLLEFRDAPPFNRLRFGCLFAALLVTTTISHGLTEPTLVTRALTSLGAVIGGALDFPFSPVRLLLIGLAGEASPEVQRAVLAAAGLSMLAVLVTLGTFLLAVRLGNWPLRSGAFNVWVNMPLFDPTAGGDVLQRLRRDARMQLALGFLVPFLVPALAKLGADFIGPMRMTDPLSLIWMTSIWAFLPTSMIMRAVALHRVADLVEEKRRRAHARAHGLQPV